MTKISQALQDALATTDRHIAEERHAIALLRSRGQVDGDFDLRVALSELRHHEEIRRGLVARALSLMPVALRLDVTPSPDGRFLVETSQIDLFGFSTVISRSSMADFPMMLVARKADDVKIFVHEGGR